MSAIDTLFCQLRSSGRKAFMPLITAGDPDLDFTAAVIRELVARGSNLCELGIPYSDPIADGPVIQASYTRALSRHTKLGCILAMVGRLTGGATTEGDGGGCRKKVLKNGKRFPDILLRPPHPANAGPISF